MDNDEFLKACLGLTKQFGIRHPIDPLCGPHPHDEWFEDAVDCFITFADDVEDGAVMIYRWVSATWLT